LKKSVNRPGLLIGERRAFSVGIADGSDRRAVRCFW